MSFGTEGCVVYGSGYSSVESQTPLFSRFVSAIGIGFGEGLCSLENINWSFRLGGWGVAK